MWNIFKADLVYNKKYYLITLVPVLVFVIIDLVLENKILQAYSSKQIVGLLNVLLFMSAYIFSAVIYNTKENRERRTALLPITLKQRKSTMYFLYLFGLACIVIIYTCYLIFSPVDKPGEDILGFFNTAVIASGGAFVVIEYLQIRLIENKLANVLVGVLIAGSILAITLIVKKYFVSILETNILYTENILAVVWAVILMFVAGYFFSKRKSYLFND